MRLLTTDPGSILLREATADELVAAVRELPGALRAETETCMHGHVGCTTKEG